jgi:tRNA dimethylallyltransferase
MSYPHLIVIAGPTASGKTDLAIKVAQLLNTEIISFDSRQFFKEIHIGTARPLEYEWQGVKHHFLGNKSIFENYSIGDFEREALAKLNELFLKHQFVIAVGGSGLYINALVNGLDDLPEADIQIRDRLNADYQRLGIGYLQDLLSQHDPEYYKVVDINNPQRMIRALEVSMAHHVPFSSYLKQNKIQRHFLTINYAIELERRVLYERINQRVDQMIGAGLLKEAISYQDHFHLNALNTVGYKELQPYLKQICSLDEAVDKIKQHTRNFAKRQITWFKNKGQYQWMSSEAILNDINTHFKMKA